MAEQIEDQKQDGRRKYCKAQGMCCAKGCHRWRPGTAGPVVAPMPPLQRATAMSGFLVRGSYPGCRLSAILVTSVCLLNIPYLIAKANVSILISMRGPVVGMEARNPLHS